MGNAASNAGDAETVKTALEKNNVQLEVSEDWEQNTRNENKSPNTSSRSELEPSFDNVEKGRSPSGNKRIDFSERRNPREPAESRRDPEAQIELREISDDDTALSTLMEASAAVFYYLSAEDISSKCNSDEISITERSAAVFEHLQQQSTSGNDAPTRQFFETAQVVSDALLLEQSKGHGKNKKSIQDADDDDSVAHQRAIIFNALTRSYRGQPSTPHLSSKRQQPQMETFEIDDDQSIISEMSQSIFRVIDETREKVAEDSVMGFSTEIFKLLDKENETHGKSDQSVISVSERSADIFQRLEEIANQDKVTPLDEEDESRSLYTHLRLRTDPNRLKMLNIFHTMSQSDKGRCSPISEEINSERLEKKGESANNPKEKEEVQSTIENPKEKEKSNEYSDGQVSEQKSSGYRKKTIDNAERLSPVVQPEVIDIESYVQQATSIPKLLKLMPVVSPHGDELQECSDNTQKEPEVVDIEKYVQQLALTAPPLHILSEEMHADSVDQEIQDEMDQKFVKQFDQVFNAFIGENPKLLLGNPKLVKSIRIKKLQKMLGYFDNREASGLTELARVKNEKAEMERQLSHELRQASQIKAAIRTKFQAEFAALSERKRFREAKTTWEIVSASETRAKRDYRLEDEIHRKQDKFSKDNISGIPTRNELLILLPKDLKGEKLRSIITATPQYFSSQSQQFDEMRKLQVDNAFLTSKISILKKKLHDLECLSKRDAWVNSVLLRLDPIQMAKLKNTFTQKLGIVNFE